MTHDMLEKKDMTIRQLNQSIEDLNAKIAELQGPMMKKLESMRSFAR